MTAEQTLREAATSGAALAVGELRSDPSYWKTAKNEFNAVTPENALKTGPLRPSPHAYDFTDADVIVDFGRKNDTSVRGRTLVRHNQKPEWFQARDSTDDQFRKFLRDHVPTVVGRYRSSIDAWDVVNEAIADDGTLRETVWYDASGEEYLDPAFQRAREVDPDADLYYDYGADEGNEKSDAVHDLLERLLERDVPVDGVGLQFPALAGRPDPESVAENVRRFRNPGLDVQITEMDVANAVDDRPENPLEERADYYREIVEVCLERGCDRSSRGVSTTRVRRCGASRTSRSGTRAIRCCSATPVTPNPPTTPSRMRSPGPTGRDPVSRGHLHIAS